MNRRFNDPNLNQQGRYPREPREPSGFERACGVLAVVICLTLVLVHVVVTR
jgi:hypothetical protein